MIRITLRTKSYIRAELTKILEKTFDSKADIDAFLTMMQETGQLTYEDGRFTPTEKREVVSVKPRYLTAPAEDQVMGNRINKIYTFRWTFYTRKGKKYPRIAIRAGQDWIERNGTPLRAILIKIKKDDKWIDIPERPVLRPGTPRYPTTIEAYRAEIPRGIVRKYNITRDTTCRLRLERRVKQFFTTLQLWGLRLQTITTTFGKTPKGEGERNLELKGEDFSYETDTNIVYLFKRNAEETLRITHKWLNDINEEYYWLLYQCNTTKDDEIPELTRGTSYDVLKEDPNDTTRITFTDLSYGRVIASGIAKLSPKWYKNNLATIVGKFSNRINISSVDRKTTYVPSLTGEEGF